MLIKKLAKVSPVAVAIILLAIGFAIAAFFYQSTGQIREALAEEILEQQHDVADLIQLYDDVLVLIERNRVTADIANQQSLRFALLAAREHLDAMRSNYSFDRLDGAAKAHSYIKPIVEDIHQWTTFGIHQLQANDPFVLEHASNRMLERLPSVRSISSETHLVATELISEQTTFLTRFRNVMLGLLLGFVFLSMAIASLLVRQRNLQSQLAIDQDASAQKVIDAETRGRLQAENALVDSEQFLRATMNSLQSEIAILNNDGIIKAVNMPWKAFVSENDNRYKDGGIDSHYQSIFKSTSTSEIERDGVNEVIKQVGDVLNQKKDAMQHEYQRSPDEKNQWSLVSMSTFYSDNARHAVLVHEDVSDRKRLEQRDQLLRSELAHTARLTTAGELATGLAHELNQPLTAITHNCDAVLSSIRDESESDSELHQTVNDISEQAHRAGKIIRGMRQLVKKDTSDKVATNINQLVRETVRLTAPEAREKGVTVTLDLAHGLPNPVIDPVQIQQVLFNLERNGTEAMWQAGSETKELTIQTCLNENSHIQVCISDTGPGVEPEFAQHLFTAFQTTKPEGMGLGLSISRTIVEDHGGRLWIDPDAEGVTMFVFSIPLDHR